MLKKYERKHTKNNFVVKIFLNKITIHKILKIKIK